MKQLGSKSALAFYAFYILFFKFAKSEPEWAISEDGAKYFIESRYDYTWLEALHECAKRNLSLATIDTSEKNRDFVNLLKNRFGTLRILAHSGDDSYICEALCWNYRKGIVAGETTGGTGLDLWIGGTESTAKKSGRKFVWTANGKTFNFANWEIGEPNNLGGNQPCVHTWSKTNNFTWADGQWHLKYGYICEETFVSNYRQIMAKKREAIKNLTGSLILYFKKEHERIGQINQAQEILLQQISIELEEKLEKTKLLIDHILEEL